MSRKLNKYGKLIVVSVPIDPKIKGGFFYAGEIKREGVATQSGGKIDGSSLKLYIRAEPNN